MINNIRRSFSFFGQKISDKYGKKCCRYHQDGKPMAPEKVQQTFSQLKEFLEGWKIGEESRSLYRHFYMEDYLMGVQFVKDIAKIDALQFKNCPGFQLKLGQLLKIQLLSPPIKGLSQLDFQLAMKINHLKLSDYSLIPLENVESYRREVMKFRNERQSKQIQDMLSSDQNK